MTEAEPMRVLQFAKRSVVTVALVSVALAGCSGNSNPDAPFNPAGTTADLEAVGSTFATSTFSSFAALSLKFDAVLGGAPIISRSAAAMDLRGMGRREQPSGTAATRAAAVESARRLASMLTQPAKQGLEASMMAIPASVAGKTFVYDLASGTYVASTRDPLPNTTVRFILYAVDPVTLAPNDPLVETGYVDLIDRSLGTTQAAQVVVVSGGVAYVDYTVTATSTASGGQVTVIGYVTDGSIQANVKLRSVLSFSGGLTLYYSLRVPKLELAVDLTLTASDIAQQTGTMTVNQSIQGPNGTVSMIGQFTSTTGLLHIKVNGDAYATITTNGTTTTITRDDGQPFTDDEMNSMNKVFEIQAGAFSSFDQMLTPVGAMFAA
jgi:hypothetical protein